MPVRVYVVNDPILISFIEDGDILGFKEYLDSDDMLMFKGPETFANEAEALAFCSGLGHGVNDLNPVPCFPLRDSEETDLPFIKAIANYL